MVMLCGDVIDIRYDNDKISINNATQSKYTEDSNGQYINNNKIVKKQDNYLITQKNNMYSLYIKYNELTKYDTVYWQMLYLDGGGSLEELINKISYFDEHFLFCTYEDDIKQCKSVNKKVDNYNEYRYYGDMILDYLNGNNLYVKSFNLVSIYMNEIHITNNSTSSFIVGEYNNSTQVSGQSFSMNSEQFYVSNNNITLLKDNSHLSIIVNLSQSIERTPDNYIKEFKNTFKK